MTVAVPPSRFVGRERELTQVARLLKKSRLVSVIGPGGSGKTRFALELLRRQGTFRMVDLSGVTDPAAVEPAVNRALYELADDTARGVLLIDNCEHLIAECARTAEVVLARSQELRLLLTSRELLGIAAETVWSLPPLTPDEAMRLFEARALARGATVEQTAENRAAIAEICRRLDQMPLAIELAAARAALLSPAEILDRLDDRFALLTAGSRTAAERHRTLRFSVEWSYDLLPADEQELFRRLSVFRGGFDVDAVEAIAGENGLDRLSRLVDRSLISVGERQPITRYAMLETLAEYGRERLRDLHELESASRAHFEHFLERAERAFAERRRSGSAELLHRLDPDLDNLRAALDWCRRSDPCAGVRLVAATREVWFRLGQAEGLRAARAMLEGCPRTSDATGWALLTAGNLALTQLQHAEAQRHLDAAADMGPPAVRAWAAWMRGVDRFLAEDYETARSILQEAVELNRGLGEPIGLGNSLASLGTVWLRLGHRAEAITNLGEALAIFERAGDRWGAGFSHTYLGIAQLAAHNTTAAKRDFESALEILAPLRDVTMLTLAVAGLAEIAAPRDWPRALRLAGAAASLRARFGGPFPPWIAESLADLERRGRAAVGRSEAERALAQGARLDAGAAVALALRASAERKSSRHPLSQRELEVGRLVLEGLSNEEIAERLRVSRRTVENHVLHILNKLGLSNRTQIAVWVRNEQDE